MCVQVKLSGRGGQHTDIVWTGNGLLITASGEQHIRLTIHFSPLYVCVCVFKILYIKVLYSLSAVALRCCMYSDGGVGVCVCVCVCVCVGCGMWSWMIITLWRWMSLWALRKENCSTVFPFALRNVRFTLLQVCATLNNVHTYTNTTWVSVLFSVWNCFTTIPFGITMIFCFERSLLCLPRLYLCVVIPAF